MSTDDKKKPDLVITTHKRRRSNFGGASPPSREHGTKVAFRITCGRCGKDATLPFVPKTTGDVLCPDCAAGVFGEDWAHGRQLDGPSEHTFKCATCGKEDRVRFKPEEDAELLCRSCFKGEETANPGRLKGKQIVTVAAKKKTKRRKPS